MGPCMSMIASAAGLPEVKFPGDEVAAKIAEILTRLPDALEESERTVKSDWEEAKSKGEDLKIMGGKGGKTVVTTIPQDADEKVIRNAAYAKVAKGKFAEEAAAEVWSAVDPKVEEQKPADAPEQVWNLAKSKVQEKVEEEVATKIGEAVDEALKKKQ